MRAVRQLLRMPRVEVIPRSPSLLVCADHHGCHTQGHDLLFPERSANCSELTALVLRNSSTLSFCRLKLPKLLMRLDDASQESYEAPTPTTVPVSCAYATAALGDYVVPKFLSMVR